jgi:dTDP-4-amino-4,6-dideoxygalactose transaminase
VAVHVAGCPADLDALGEIARRRGLILIEDAAQAHLAEWRGRPVGAIGHAGTFSFQASKNLNAGEGGVVLTDDDEIFERCWSLANCGRVRDGGWYEHRMLSGNYRLSELQAALLLSQSRRLEEQTERRTRNALYLAGQLAEIEGIRPLARDSRVTRHAYHLFVFRYDAAAFGGMSRDHFLTALKAEGVPCSPGYTPLYRSPAFRIDTATHPFPARVDYGAVRLPNAEQASAEAVWLTQGLLLGERADLDDIVAAVRKIQTAVR